MTPRTSAGQRLLQRLDVTPRPYVDFKERGSWEQDVLAIEAEAGALDRAWAEAVAALPDGAYIGTLSAWTIDTRTGKPAEWAASASHQTRRGNWNLDVRGPTPAAALLELARRLREAD